MQFRIADTFTDSLSRLSGDEQKHVKTTAFDLQMNPANPGMSFHKLDRAKDKNFWSVRVSRDIRIIVHKTASSLMLCYVGHHDQAYDWAERRKIEAHPKTGAAQIVEIRERVEEITVPVYVQQTEAVPAESLFEEISDDVLLGFGVPEEWLPDVRSADEDGLLTLVDHLPDEAAEALLELATGGQPATARLADFVADPFQHPDAQRRFRVMANSEELALALDYPWDKWTVFLHPAQRDTVERDYNGPARVAGSAGTGKTIVALHRAVHLVRTYPDARVLLTTFSELLANALRRRLTRLIANDPRLGERIEVHALDEIGDRLYRAHIGTPNIASHGQIAGLLQEITAQKNDLPTSLRFIQEEWGEVVDAWQLESWADYRDVRRLGRKTRLPERSRETLWTLFEALRERLLEDDLITRPMLFAALTKLVARRSHPPFDFVVVDEAQDVNVPQLRFLAALGGNRPNGLFFAGDLGQRIFQTPFSWSSLGVDVRGRSGTLRVNYRTSHQIRARADRLLGPELADVDGNVEERLGTVSVFNGPNPVIRSFQTPEEESSAVGEWLRTCLAEGVEPREIGIFVRSEAEIARATAAADIAELSAILMDERMAFSGDAASICTMHLAKGLEFRAVAVMACDDEIVPLQERIESVADNADLEEVYDTERHLLYVAFTRAREYLLVTSTEPSSEFLDDLTISF